MDYSILSRSYDLRGIYGTDIDDDFFFRLGYAFVRVTGKSRIALGHDARLSSPPLKSAFSRGVNFAGGNIIDIGLCSSDMLSFATCYYDDIDAGVMITASHNPKEYNGMKSLTNEGDPYNLKKYGPLMIQEMEQIDTNFISDAPVSIEYRDVLSDWVDHIYEFIGGGEYSRFRVVADGGNGSAGVFMAQLARRCGFELIPLFLEPDGNFPYHHPNPMLEKNRIDAKKMLLEMSADIAMIFDGDADRVILLDEKGIPINSAVISAVIVDAISERVDKTARFIGNAVASHNFRDFVEEKGMTYIREMVGHVYIREHMKSDPKILYAGEHSAHYFFRDNYFMDSGIVAAMVFLSVIARSGKSVSEYVAHYIRYISLEETNFEVSDPKGAIKKLSEIYKSEKYDLFDGITVEYPDGSWWNFRPSSNEPLLRLNMEARTQERFDALYQEIHRHIVSFGSISDE